MAIQQIYVGHTLLSVDIEEELRPYFDGYKVRWTEEKISSPSPFRYDKSPSFLVNLVHTNDKTTAGTWKDSGTGETGKLEHLLSFLRNESLEETVQYLREKYEVKAYDRLRLSLDFKVKKEWKPLLFQGSEFAFGYLNGRGIPDNIIKQAGVMDLEDKVVFHWYNPLGQIVAIKYRYKDRKDFFYAKGGKRLNEQLYNIQRVYEKGSKCASIWLCEGEVDSLSIEGLIDRYVGVAMGGASFSDKQRDTLLRAGVKHIVIATDNDRQGHVVAKRVFNKLEGYVTLWRTDLGDCKDINEYTQKYGCLPPINKWEGKSIW